MNNFLNFSQNIYCGYSMESPHQGNSNEYQYICFCEELRKRQNFFSCKKSSCLEVSQTHVTLLYLSLCLIDHQHRRSLSNRFLGINLYKKLFPSVINYPMPSNKGA